MTALENISAPAGNVTPNTTAAAKARATDLIIAPPRRGDRISSPAKRRRLIRHGLRRPNSVSMRICRSGLQGGSFARRSSDAEALAVQLQGAAPDFLARRGLRPLPAH